MSRLLTSARLHVLGSASLKAALILPLPFLPLSHGQAFISRSEPAFPSLLSPPEGNQQLAAALQRAFRPGRDTFIFIYCTSLLRLVLAGELENVCVWD